MRLEFGEFLPVSSNIRLEEPLKKVFPRNEVVAGSEGSTPLYDFPIITSGRLRAILYR